MRVEFNETNKTPLNMIGERCIYSLFIYQNKKKTYTKSVIKYIYRITIWNKYNIIWFTNLHVSRYNQK